MKTTYLLPCQCGERFQVDASESGLVMKCRCGASLEVPTLRGLSRLEKVVVEEPASPARTWGGAQRMMAIGALIALVGIAMSIYWTVKPLPRPQDVLSAETFRKLRLPDDGTWIDESPKNVLGAWRMIELEIQIEGLYGPPAQALEPYHRAREIVVWWRVLSYVVAGLGLAILAASFLAFQLGRSRRAAPRQFTPAS
jgi:hypothetical protein